MTYSAEANNIKLLEEPRPIRADMPLEEAVDRLASLSHSRPEGSRVLEITPELAQHILSTCNVANRPMKPGKVREYANAMAKGQWGLTGDTIKFSDEGVLRDGQNRLAAAVRAKHTLVTHVVFNVDADLFARMDIGKNRTPADVFHIAGFSYANYVAATTRWLLILTSENPNNRGAYYSPEDLLRAYRERFNPMAIEDSVKLALEVKKAQGAPVAATAALHYLMSLTNKEKADAFMADWISGQGGPTAPTRRLQQALVDISLASNGRVHETVRNALIVRAFNAYYHRRSMKKTEMDFVPGESEFPKLLGKPLKEVATS